MAPARLLEVYIADGPTCSPRRVERVEAEPGRGLRGDRYYNRTGTFWRENDLAKEVTLIQREVIDASEEIIGHSLCEGRHRRNLVTIGVSLNELVSRRFLVGEVTMEGIRLCEPCDYLGRLTDSRVKELLRGRGGLRARILNKGELREGDVIHTEPVCETTGRL